MKKNIYYTGIASGMVYRQKMSEQKIENKAWLGKKHTEESKSKMRKPKTKKYVD